MGPIRLLTRSPRPKEIERISCDVAEQCREAVHARLRDTIRKMSLSEARGYIRARAGHVVRRETRIALPGDSRHAVQARGRIVHLATERVVHSVIRDLIAQPAPSIRLRRAG